jgi:hypothetical protein
VVGGEVVDRSVGRVDSGGGLVGGGWVATGAESGGDATVVSGVVVGSELDGGSTDVGRVGAGAEAAGAGPGGLGRGAAMAAGVETGAAVAVELGPTTSPNTVAGSAVVGTSNSQAAIVGIADVNVSEVVVAVVNVRRAVVGGGAASDAGVGVGPSPGPPELGPCHSVTRANRTTSSTEMTASATVLPDGRWSALPGCGRSLTSMRQYYPTRRHPTDGPFDPFTNATWGRDVRLSRARGQCHARECLGGSAWVALRPASGQAHPRLVPERDPPRARNARSRSGHGAPDRQFGARVCLASVHTLPVASDRERHIGGIRQDLDGCAC